MPGFLHQGFLSLLCARPGLIQQLWTLAEPEAGEYTAGLVPRIQDSNTRVESFATSTDSHRWPDLVATLHANAGPEAQEAQGVLVVECQLRVDPEKFYTWTEYLGAARRKHRTWGRLLVLTPNAEVIAWARRSFANEPHGRPEFIGPDQIPKVTDVADAIENPELAVLSTIVHAFDKDDGAMITQAAAHALRTLPLHTRKEYFMILSQILPEITMNDIQDISFDPIDLAKEPDEDWIRERRPYVFEVGVRQGQEEGLQAGQQAGLRLARRSLLDMLEIRELVPTEAERAKIVGENDLDVIDRWLERAKRAAAVSELFGTP